MSESRKLKAVKYIAIVIAVLFIIGLSIPEIWFAYEALWGFRAKRVKLVYKTDHLALREACKSVLKDANEGEWEYERRYNIWLEPDPNSKNFPKEILNLKPSNVYVGKGRLRIEMFGGFVHLGIIVFSDDYDREQTKGNMKLADDIWYYDDGYIGKEEKFQKYIDSLKPK